MADAIYNQDTYVHASSGGVNNVGMSFIMITVIQHPVFGIAKEKQYGN